MKCQPRRGRSTRAAVLIALALVSVMFTGCAFDRSTDPARTAIEQLLLSTSVDRCLGVMETTALKDKKVFIDTSNFESYDKGYAISALRNKISSGGALILNDKAKADVIVEARCGGLSIDRNDSLIGIPSIPLPIPYVGPLVIPEIAIFKKTEQESVAKIDILAYEQATGKHVFSTTDTYGESYYNRWTLLIIFKFRTTDIPERLLNRRRTMK